ncbi:hypothetical protein [uncultured Oscillibacter sp.]|jgi:hypothetical protein|uniref:hypothetical protein n=1 Tax=uncultured Oscillibacter sp. TaxID=876091 RepID=UPI002604F0EE|nr:hypothetical protein [uncultured Oscillibacter sp.]
MDRIILERSALLIERADVPRAFPSQNPAGSIEAAVMEQRIFSAFLAGLFLGSSSIKR